MSEVVLAGEHATGLEWGSLYQRTTLIEKALFVITGIGLALITATLGSCLVSVLSWTSVPGSVYGVVALALVILGLRPYRVYSSENTFARLGHDLYFFKSKGSSWFTPTICSIQGLHLGPDDTIFVTSGMRVFSEPYVIAYDRGRQSATIHDLERQTSWPISLPDVQQLKVDNQMLLCLEEGTIQARDFDGNKVYSLGTDIADFCVRDGSVIALSNTGTLKVYRPSSLLLDAATTFFGQERFLQYQFPEILKGKQVNCIQPLSSSHVLVALSNQSSLLIEFHTGKVRAIHEIDVGLTPVMVGEEIWVYRSHGCVYVQNIVTGSRQRLPFEGECLKLESQLDYFYTLDSEKRIRVWHLEEGQAIEVKKEVSEGRFDDFVIGGQDTGLLAVKGEEVVPYWEDGGAYLKPPETKIFVQR